MSAEFREAVGDELAGRIELLQKRARGLAPEASARLNLAATNLKKVGPEATYSWVDPTSFAHEVEMSAGRGAETLNAIRNAVILVPIALTWAALAAAAWGYFIDLKTNPDDIHTPFLALWQSGFRDGAHNLNVPNLTAVGIADFLILSFLLALTVVSQTIERNAQRKSQQLTQELNGITSDLVQIAGKRKVAPTVGADSSVQEVADAMQAVISEAMEESRKITEHATASITQVAQSAEASVTAAQKATADLLTGHLGPMIDTFNTRLASLQTQLAEYQQRLASLSTASQGIADAADKLGANAGAYMTAATLMTNHIEHLRDTQSELITQIGGVGSALQGSSASLKQVADSIGADAVDRIRETNINLGEMTNSLRETQQSLESAANGLDAAAARLEKVQVVGGGIIGLIFNRRQRQRRV
jgi:hypothetical protein